MRPSLIVAVTLPSIDQPSKGVFFDFDFDADD
jgi:hypothetical protein